MPAAQPNEPGTRMRRVLVFQHVPYEILGTLDPLLRARRIRIRYVNFGRHPDARPDLAGYDAVIVLGGPMNVDEAERFPHLRTELGLIGEALGRGMPVLGICLGAQLLAHALGAAVGRNPVPELGWVDVAPTSAASTDPVLGVLDQPSPIFQWHGDTFDLPPGAELLATSNTCRNQAFRFGKHAYGLQFHLEVDAPLVERWLCVHEAELHRVAGPDAAQRIRAETQRHAAGQFALSQEVFGRLLTTFGWQAREPLRWLGHGPVPGLGPESRWR